MKLLARSVTQWTYFWIILFFLVTQLFLLAAQEFTLAYESKHPLDSLSAQEITTVVETLKIKGLIKENSRFATINLHEPPKQAVWNWKQGNSIPQRNGFVVVKQDSQVFEGVVSLTARNVLSWQEVKGVQPAYLDEEYNTARDLVKSDPRWQTAMRKRGIADFETVVCTPLMYSPGYFGSSPLENRRLILVPCALETGDKNFWAHPITGVQALVDLNAKKVIEVKDTGVLPIPKKPAGLSEPSITAQVSRWGRVPNPLLILQPKGPTFKVDGHLVSWQNWQFHFKIDPRVGPIISTVTYNWDGKPRSVLYEGFLGEIFVPYGDPSPEWYNRTFMDVGEFNLGKLAVPLQSNLDCPMNAVYFDAVFADGQGQPYKQPKVACLFEQRGDGGVEWRHYESFNESNESRSRRELVLRFISTIGNYDYIFDWVFLQNGAIQVRVGASGIEEVKAVNSSTVEFDRNGRDTLHGSLVDEYIVAPIHQHIYNFRLDLDVDGIQNSFMEVVPKAIAVENNLRTSAMVLETKSFHTELEARRSYDLMSMWHVVNPNVKNANGDNVSYMLHKGGNTYPLLSPNDWPRKRAGFIDYSVWVTPYNPQERYPVGDYPTQSKGGDGLPSWTQTNRSIENTDIVLWYTMGNTHIVRPEDWPVLTTEWVSFELSPFNFFNRTPSLSLPRYH